MVDFKPSQVDLTPMPLVGTFNHSESEAAATLLVRAMVRNGDRWQAIEFKQIGEAIKADIDSKTDPIHVLSTNPFWGPDIDKLIDEGFARWTDLDTDRWPERGSPVEFTEKGLAAMREKHVLCGAVDPKSGLTCQIKIDHKRPGHAARVDWD